MLIKVLCIVKDGYNPVLSGEISLKMPCGIKAAPSHLRGDNFAWKNCPIKEAFVESSETLSRVSLPCRDGWNTVVGASAVLSAVGLSGPIALGLYSFTRRTCRYFNYRHLCCSWTSPEAPGNYP